MLEMTENVTTAQTETGASGMPPAYARDLAITAVFCFTGGGGLALLVCYQLIRRKKLKEGKRQKEEDKERSAVVNHNVTHLGVSEKRRKVFPRWDKESMMLDARTESHSGQFESRAAENGHFRCPDCSHKGQRGMRPNPMTMNYRMNTDMEEDEEVDKQTMGRATEEERRKPGIQQGILSRDIVNHANVFSQPRRETLRQRPENQPVYETGRDMGSYRIDVEDKNVGHGTLHCEGCHRTYRAPQQAMRPGRFESPMRDPAVFNGFPPQHRWSRNHNQFDIMKTTELRRESRNVTFDMGSLRSSEKGSHQVKEKRDEEVGKSRGEEREKRDKVQSSKLLKVKLNLNPLRKSKVHPKKKREQDHSEKGSSRKSHHGKRQHGKDDGRKEGRREKSGHKKKGSPEKLKKSSTSSRSSDDGVIAKKEEDEEEGKQKGTLFENEQTVQQQHACPENPQPGDPTSAEDQSSPAVAPGQVETSQAASVQHQEAGLPRITNLPLLGSPGSQLTGSRLSLQRGDLLLNNMAPELKALFTSGPSNSAAPGVTISGPNLAASGNLDGLSRQIGGGIMSAALLANTIHANALQANPIQAGALHNSQAGGLALNAAADPAAVIPEPIQSLLRSQLPPDSSSFLARLTSDAVHVLGLQTGKALPQLTPESQAPQIKEGLPVQAQAADSLSIVTSQTLGTVETENGRVPEGLTSAGSAVEVLLSEGSVQTAEAPVAGVGGDAAVLLHQEYLSEDGDSSPRRKLRLALPEKTSSRPLTALERKIR